MHWQAFICHSQNETRDFIVTWHLLSCPYDHSWNKETGEYTFVYIGTIHGHNLVPCIKCLFDIRLFANHFKSKLPWFSFLKLYEIGMLAFMNIQD